MNKFIKNIVAFSLKNKFFTYFLTIVLIITGIYSYHNTPIEAFPDFTNTQIIIISQWRGKSAEEVEKFVTVPLEIAMTSVQKKTNVRSISMFGLSVIKILFEDDVEDFYARQQVNNAIASVNLPEGVDAEVQPPYGPTGEIFRYTIKSNNRDSRDLLTYQDWIIRRQLLGVPGVADVVTFGGQQKVYEINVIPGLLEKYNLSALDVYNAVSKSNLNVGGDVIEKNDQAYVVRGIGLINSKEEIGDIVISNIDDTPITVKDIADVEVASLPRVGQVGMDHEDDIIEGIVVMRKGENPHDVLKNVKDKVDELNTKVLPADIKMVTFYDRDNLIDFCTHTVLGNLTEGIILVILIVFLFMADLRATLIVSLIIPLSLLFAFMCLRLKGMSANLISMGAIDFGIIIDGAIVMVEGMFVALEHRAREVGLPKYRLLSKLGLIKNTGGELAKAIFFSKLIIITALIPIFAFQRVEGKIFSPLAYTLGFALLGALIFTLTLVPVLTSHLFRHSIKEKKNPFVNFITNSVLRIFHFTYSHKRMSLLVAFLVMLLSLYSFRYLGTEFLPPLNEGALWVEAQMPMSMSLKETVKLEHKIREVILSFKEVQSVLSQTGRSNDGTDPSGFFLNQACVDLYPKEQWKRKITMDQLIDEIDAKLSQFQGINFNYSQPIRDNVEEAVAGLNCNNAIKIYGENLEVLDSLSKTTMNAIKDVKGIREVGILKNIGQPELRIDLDEHKLAAYGILKEDCQAIIEMAIGGKAVTQLYDGEKKFDIRVRYPQDYRKDEDDIKNLMIPTIKGTKVPLSEIANIGDHTGSAFIYRDLNKRLIAVKFTVRDRDLGSTIKEAQERVNRLVKFPKGYSITWTGEFESQVRATNRLAQVVPLCLVLIFILLFITFGNVKDAGLVLMNVPFALIGGILALHITGVFFGISAGVGFIALFGLCVQNGVILISVFKKNIELKMTLDQAILKGVTSRIRPVIMTAMMAAIGLLPAALSNGIGSESQKPLAIVVIGGLITATILTLFIFPIMFKWVYRGQHASLLDK
ncbi:MAG: efflux RND transporter permease subunit [Bacteroidetes bacterium]|nr:efflux RND transporter permease subunit [Bacteroidota bacterium]